MNETNALAGGAHRRSRRRRAAELLGQWVAALEAVHGDAVDSVLDDIAHHYFEAARLGMLQKAIEFAIRTGQRAYAQVGYEEAAGRSTTSAGRPDRARRWRCAAPSPRSPMPTDEACDGKAPARCPVGSFHLRQPAKSPRPTADAGDAIAARYSHAPHPR
jgi:hypothetical protein